MVKMGILYVDGSKVWKPVSDAGLFVKIGVLTFSFTTERGNRSALLLRMWSRQNNDIVARRDKAWWGDDIYYVGVMPDGRYFTTQVDENDEKIMAFSVEDGERIGTIDCPRNFPADATIHRFIGGYLEPDEWKKALIIFEREMF